MNSPVSTSWIDIAPGFAGYLALPPGGSGPGLVLWQEIFGVNDHIRTVAEQYALDGFVCWRPTPSGARRRASNSATTVRTVTRPSR